VFAFNLLLKLFERNPRISAIDTPDMVMCP
jgi:hypothetical protein